MALLLRTLNKAKWIAPEWTPERDVPADALTDLRTSSNALSVWKVDVNRDNLGGVLEALASNRERLDKLDYALIDEAAVAQIPIAVAHVEGDSPHTTANRDHRDLVKLTVFKIALLAHEIMPLVKVRLTQKQVAKLLLDAFRAGRLDPERLKPGLLAELRELSGPADS
jgi:hypothetical protein